jgi:hypothetical protein
MPAIDEETPTCHSCGTECSNIECVCDDCELQKFYEWLETAGI